jgi:hypothetical protein
VVLRGGEPVDHLLHAPLPQGLEKRHFDQGAFLRSGQVDAEFLAEVALLRTRQLPKSAEPRVLPVALVDHHGVAALGGVELDGQHEAVLGEELVDTHMNGLLDDLKITSVQQLPILLYQIHPMFMLALDAY